MHDTKEILDRPLLAVYVLLDRPWNDGLTGCHLVHQLPQRVVDVHFTMGEFIKLLWTQGWGANSSRRGWVRRRPGPTIPQVDGTVGVHHGTATVDSWNERGRWCRGRCVRCQDTESNPGCFSVTPALACVQHADSGVRRAWQKWAQKVSLDDVDSMVWSRGLNWLSSEWSLSLQWVNM